MLLDRNGISGHLERAEEECARFLAATKELRKRLREDEHAKQYAYITGCPETAAVRRASLDLTRALAKMRKTS